jgi:hypothetical protein
MNNAWTLSVILLMFFLVFGYFGVLGNEIYYSPHSNLDSESLEHIQKINNDLNNNYNFDTGDGSGIENVNYDKTTSADADPEDRDFFASRSDASDLEIGYNSIKKTPDTILDSVPFIERSSALILMAVLGSLLSLSIFIAFYKFWRTGKADNE